MGGVQGQEEIDADVWMAASVQGGLTFGQQTAGAVFPVTNFYKSLDKQSYICTHFPIFWGR